MIFATDLAARWNLRAVRGRREWRGTCPVCLYSETFALTERNGRLLAWCACCQDRTAIAALMRSAFGDSAFEPLSVGSHDRNAVAGQKSAIAARLWASATVRGLHHTYLSARGIPGLAQSLALRFEPDCPHPGGRKLPAMLALVQDVAGEHVAIHRTYLRDDGSGKADVEPAKASLGPIWGGVIRLDPVAEQLVIGEGIESSVSVR